MPVAAAPDASAPPSPETLSAEPAANASSAAPVSPNVPAEVRTLQVGKDKRVFVVFGDESTSRVFVYLHGRCGDPLAFSAWADVARHFGTIVSFIGDVKCDGGRAKWGADIVALDQRISRALVVVEAERKAPLDKEHLVAIGYSAGALRAEALSTRFSDRYPRVILIGGPRAPRPGGLQQTRSILLMAGQLDIRQPLMDAATDLAKAGRHARFIVIPHARHGEYGPEASETMQEALAWTVDETDADDPGQPLKTSKAAR